MFLPFGLTRPSNLLEKLVEPFRVYNPYQFLYDFI